MALILYTNFEDTSYTSNWIAEICRPDAIVIQSAIKRKGTSSARFNFKKSDVIDYDGFVRAELRQGAAPQKNQWYAFSSYLPADHVSDPIPEVIAQWHEIPDWDLGENWRSPPIALRIENDHYYVKYLWAAAPVNTNDSKDGEKTIDLGPVDKAVWIDWVFHINFAYTAYGTLEVFKNKQKIYTLHGPNSFNDIFNPYFKVGMYKWGWNGFAEFSPEDERTVYIDEVRIGDSNSNLDEVSPTP